jgi:hypothetical protein
VPVVAGDGVDASSDDPVAHPTRIVETFDAVLAAAPTADSVAIARLRQVRGRWRADARFKPARLGRPLRRR